MYFNKLDPKKNECMLDGAFAVKGYDWWWHSFTAKSERTGEEKPFFIEFYLCNPGLGEAKPVFGQLPENKAAGKKPSYLMVKAGCWGDNAKQIHRFFGWKDVKLHAKKPFSVEADDCFVSDTTLKGHVSMSKEDATKHTEYMSDAGEMSFDLRLEKKVAFNVGYGTSPLFRFLKAFEMYWHAEGMKTLYSGTIVLDGERYVVEKESSYGYADKNWGCGFTSPWVWLSSNCMTSNLTGESLNNSVFDIGGGCPRIFGVPLPRKLLSAFWYEGMEYEFNFSKFWTLTRTKFSMKETKNEIIWYVCQENRKALMRTKVRCRKKDMLHINYEAPDGSKRHNRLWNGGNGVGRVQIYQKHEGGLILIDDLSVTHVGCEYGEYDK